MAAFGGGPVTLRDMTDDDVAAMFRPKLDVVALLHRLSLRTPGAPVRVVLVDLRTARLALAGPLRGDHHVPGHLRLCPPSGRTSGHRDQLGALEVIVRQPNRRTATASLSIPGSSRCPTRSPSRHCLGHRPWHPGALHRSSRPTGPGSPPPIADPRIATHRGRPAADEPRRTSSTPVTEFREALRNCEPARRRDMLVDHVDCAVVAAMGLASPQTAGSVDGLLPVRDGLADERDASTGPCPTPSASRCPLPWCSTTRRSKALADYLATILPELVEVADAKRPSTPTTTSVMTTCSKNFLKG